MIESKEDLKRYLEMDKIALGKAEKCPHMFDWIWKFEIALRKHEYYLNCTTNKIMQKYYKYKHLSLGVKLGFDIPVNVFGGATD